MSESQDAELSLYIYDSETEELGEKLAAIVEYAHFRGLSNYQIGDMAIDMLHNYYNMEDLFPEDEDEE